MKALKKTVATLAVMFTFVIGGAAPIVPATTVAHAKTTYVYIAPESGKRYHFNRHCRGLRFANKIDRVTLHWARHHHYTKCKLE